MSYNLPVDVKYFKTYAISLNLFNRKLLKLRKHSSLEINSIRHCQFIGHLSYKRLSYSYKITIPMKL